MKFKWGRVFIVVGQKVLVTILLFVTYVLCFGITNIFTRIFNKELFNRKNDAENSFWVEARGYECDDNEIMRQS